MKKSKIPCPDILNMKRAANITDGCLTLKAPMLDVKTRISGISAVECRSGRFKENGIRVWGYGGLHNSSGTFSLKGYGTVKLAMDERVPAYIIVRYGEGRTMMFNLATEKETREFHRSLIDACGNWVKTVVEPPTPEEGRGQRNNTRLLVLIAPSVASAAVCIAIAIWVVFCCRSVRMQRSNRCSLAGRRRGVRTNAPIPRTGVCGRRLCLSVPFAERKNRSNLIGPADVGPSIGF